MLERDAGEAGKDEKAAGVEAGPVWAGGRGALLLQAGIPFGCGAGLLLILTFFPVLICINAFIGLLHLDINAVLEAASPFLPRETLGILGDYIQYITGNQSPACWPREGL